LGEAGGAWRDPAGSGGQGADGARSQAAASATKPAPVPTDIRDRRPADGKAAGPAARRPEPSPQREPPDEDEPEPERREPPPDEGEPAPAEVRRDAAPPAGPPHGDAAEAEPEPRGPASPLAQRPARAEGRAIERVRGTGPGGRIVERDVAAAVAAGATRQAAQPAPARPVVAPTGRRVEPGKMRQTTARRMAEAKRDIPHFYASSDVPMDECAHLKEGL